jgi:UDP-2,3-diacylglucosamine pyrophosphatase LpxH
MSDFHMGYKGFDAIAALNFLKTHQPQKLYLLGDIIDGWKLEARWYWCQAYSDLIDYIFEMIDRGVKVYYCPGNHDEKMRDLIILPARIYFSHKFGFHIDEGFVYETKQGKRLRLIHGDQFDGRIRRRFSLPLDRLYDLIIDKGLIKPKIQKTIKDGQKKRWSLREAISQNGTHYLNKRTIKAAYKSIEKDYDGIIYGHSHVPNLEFKTDDKLIGNSGAWTLRSAINKNHHAIIETLDGELQLLQWPVTKKAEKDILSPVQTIRNITAQNPNTKKIAKLIYQLWCGGINFPFNRK